MYSLGKKVSQKQPTSHRNSPQTSMSPAESSLCFSKELSPGASKSELSILTLQIFNFWKKKNLEQLSRFLWKWHLEEAKWIPTQPNLSSSGLYLALAFKEVSPRRPQELQACGILGSMLGPLHPAYRGCILAGDTVKRKPLAFHIPSKTLSKPSLRKALQLPQKSLNTPTSDSQGNETGPGTGRTCPSPHILPKAIPHDPSSSPGRPQPSSWDKVQNGSAEWL